MPQGCLSDLISNHMKIHVQLAKHIDANAEIARIDKKLKKMQNLVEACQKRLDKMVKAPEEVKEKTRAKLKDYQAQVEQYQAGISQMQSLL